MTIHFSLNKDVSIKNFVALPDEEKVRLLKDGNAVSWEYIYLYVVLPFIKNKQTQNGVPFRAILADKSIEPRDVLHDLYLMMVRDNKLENFQFKCPLNCWLRWYVKKKILEYCRKYPSPVSETETEPVSITENPSRDASLEACKKSFKELWRRNPMRAYVLLLKNQNCYSSTEIKNYLGLSSEDNVDQHYSRAKKELEELITRFSEEEQP